MAQALKHRIRWAAPSDKFLSHDLRKGWSVGAQMGEDLCTVGWCSMWRRATGNTVLMYLDDHLVGHEWVKSSGHSSTSLELWFQYVSIVNMSITKLLWRFRRAKQVLSSLIANNNLVGFFRSLVEYCLVFLFWCVFYFDHCFEWNIALPSARLGPFIFVVYSFLFFCWSLAHQCARSFWHAYDLWEGWLIQALIGCRLALIIFWAATEPNVITGNPTNLKFREPCPYGQVSCQVTCSLSMIDSNISPKDIRVCHCLPSCWPFTVYTAHGCYNPRCMNQRMQ